MNSPASAFSHLGRIRSYLKRTQETLRDLNLQLKVKAQGSERYRKVEASIKLKEQRESELLDDIARSEATAFGDWAPKNPPSPEESERIRKAQG